MSLPSTITTTTTAQTTDGIKRKLQEIEKITKKCKLELHSKSINDVNDIDTHKIFGDILNKSNENSSSIIDASSSSSTTTTTEYVLQEKSTQIQCPKFGQIVNRREFRRAGPYLIGLKLGHSPVDSIVQYLAKKENSNEFVQLKILVLNNNTRNEKLLQDERQGKMLLHTEYSLLSLLENQEGVIQQHGLFSDMAFEEVQADSFSNNNYFTGGLRKRLVLVLDCVTPHDFDSNSTAYINLQQYLINRKKLTEIEALKIFYEIVGVVESLHKRNVIHRDLKFGNIVLNKQTNKVKIINFCLGKYLLNENDLLYDQRGSPAYISPDVLCGNPYKGKPSDMWALGVVLFMMLYRQFPFFESTPTALFKKIKTAEYFIPINSDISEEAEQIIKGLLQLSPEQRLTASQVRDKLKLIIDCKSVKDTDRLVPDINDDAAVPKSSATSKRYLKTKQSTKRNSNDSSRDQIVPILSKPVEQTSSPIPNLSQKRKRATGESPTLAYLRAPNFVSVEHVGHDARQLTLSDIGQFQLLIRSNQSNRSAANWPATIRFRSVSNSNSPMQMTQQMSNLSLRGRYRTTIPATQSQLISRSNSNSHRNRGHTINNNSPSVNSSNNNNNNNIRSNDVDNIDNYSRYLTQLYRCAMASRALSSTNYNEIDFQYIFRQSYRPRTNVTGPNRRLAVNLGDPIKKLFETFNEMFIRGRIPNQHSTNLDNFTGIITEDLANKIIMWLARSPEYHYHSAVQEFIVGSRYASSGTQVHDFLSRCGITMETVNGQMKVKREQTLDLLMMMTYLLQAAGYNNTYFTSD